MKEASIPSGACGECVFQRTACVLGNRRPWNAPVCDDYRPYCVACGYPDMFCNTCRNQSSKGLKPLEMDMKSDVYVVPQISYDCVWSPPEARFG